MSSSQTPYIGSKISLISKLDIRYEGILYTVDTNDATIALAKVRSYGTEKRPTSNPVAARDDIYEYIIFKASDIKDLIVCDTPKMASVGAGITSDPAIISVSSRSAPASADVSTAGPPSPNSPLAKILTQQRPGRGHHQNFQLNFNTYRSGAGYHQRGYNNYGVPRVYNREKLTFDSDFDFEKANEKFQEVTDDLEKLKVTDDEQPKVNEDNKDESCYDKKSSFFDNISCETLEQAAGKTGRPDWNKERETNQETFGHNSVRYYRRGFGPRAYGGHNGYGGYNNAYQSRSGYNGGYRQNYGGHRRHVTYNNHSNNVAIIGN
ncbi:unnamed protein product [Caenorhabditis brenneri]